MILASSLFPSRQQPFSVVVQIPQIAAVRKAKLQPFVYIADAKAVGNQASLCDTLQKWYVTYADPAVDGSREAVTGFGQMRRPGIYAKGKPVYAQSPKYQK